MPASALPKVTADEIERMVSLYSGRRVEFGNFAKRVESDLLDNAELRPLIHSSKKREKDPAHLRDKLIRKATEAKERGKRFTITQTNLFKRVGDLAGVRLLHIHTDQLAAIHPIMLKILAFYEYKLRERPLVYIWDLERKAFLAELGLNVKIRPTMYTSVHYVVEWADFGCEIQVRTLAEELWGEVSHTINYPHETDSIACTQQLAVLARVASGCTRLVDSIFASMGEHKARQEDAG